MGSTFALDQRTEDSPFCHEDQSNFFNVVLSPCSPPITEVADAAISTGFKASYFVLGQSD